MDAQTAMTQTNQLVTGMIAALEPSHREMSTPCDQWTVHDLIEHMCGGAHMIAGGLQGQAPPEEMPDFLAEGPANGWANAVSALEGAVTPETLSATHQMPFGEVPGEVAVSVIVSDHITHAWDLAQATGIAHNISDELADFALQSWRAVVPADGRTGDGFKAVVAGFEEGSAVDQLAAYTGRQP